MSKTPTYAVTASQQIGVNLLRDLRRRLEELVLNPDAEVPEDLLAVLRETYDAARRLIIAGRNIGIDSALRNNHADASDLPATYEAAGHALKVLERLYGPQMAVGI